MSDDLYYFYQAFNERFPNSETCLQHLVRFRWPEGFVCPRCGQSRGYFLEDRKLYECVVCKFQVSATSGTIFHNSHINLHKWYWLIFHLAMYKKRFSIKYIQNNFMIRTYKTAWSMAQKVNRVVSKIDKRSGISGFIKLKMDNSPNQAPPTDIEPNQEINFLFSLISCINENNQYEEFFIYVGIITNSYEDSIEYILGEIEDYLELGGININTILDEVESNGWNQVTDNRKIEGYNFSDISICNLKDDIDHLSVIEKILKSFKYILSHREVRITGREIDHFFTSLVDQFNFDMFNMKVFDQVIRESIPR